jgi:prolyl oligopeptidase
MWIRSDDNKDPQARLNPKTKLHAIGNDASRDEDFFSNERYPGLNIDPAVYPFAFLSDDAKDYIFAYEATVQSEFTLHYAPVSEVTRGI